MVEGRRVCAHRFKDPNTEEETYWRDIGTLDAYYQANMDLLFVHPLFNLYEENWPIRTYQPQHPPAKLALVDEGSGARRGEAQDSIVSGGCFIGGGRVIRSVLSPRVRIESQAQVEDSVLLEGVVVGRGARVRNAIIDKFVAIPAGTTIGYNQEEDKRRFTLTPSGIVVCEKRMPMESDLDLRQGEANSVNPSQPSLQPPFGSVFGPQASL